MSETAKEALPPCPICGKPGQPDTKPFCSARCADIDLGRWLGERYAIPGPEEEDVPFPSSSPAPDRSR